MGRRVLETALGEKSPSVEASLGELQNGQKCSVNIRKRYRGDMGKYRVCLLMFTHRTCGWIHWGWRLEHKNQEWLPRVQVDTDAVTQKMEEAWFGYVQLKVPAGRPRGTVQ